VVNHRKLERNTAFDKALSASLHLFREPFFDQPEATETKNSSLENPLVPYPSRTKLSLTCSNSDKWAGPSHGVQQGGGCSVAFHPVH
jgi:hypothetical protein